MSIPNFAIARKKRLKTFVYLDLIWTDAPIADPDLVASLRDMVDDTRMNIRFKRTQMFLDYLNSVEEKDRKLTSGTSVISSWKI